MANNLLEDLQQETAASVAYQSTPSIEKHFSTWQKLAICLLLTFAAVLIHGYHPFSEDAAVYVPAIKKQLDPSLYPKGSEFFLSPAQYSIFTRVVAETVELLHIRVSYALLGWYCVSLFAFLIACWRVCELTLKGCRAPLYGTLLLTALLTIPIAGSSLLLSDPYLTSRSMCTPVLLFAVCAVLEDRFVLSGALLTLAALIHPLMAAYAAVFLLVLFAIRKEQWRPLILLGTCSVGFLAAIAVLAGRVPLSQSYRAAVLTRTYFFLSNWTWYELLGLAAPMAIFTWLGWRHRERASSRIGACYVATAIYAAGFCAVGVAITCSQHLMIFARYQPMRSFHLVYILMFLLPVNLVLQRMTKNRPALLILVLLGVSIGMFTTQRLSFPATSHIEWPGTRSDNPWQQAFEWIRGNTPKNAVFALDPEYMDEPTEDHHGFRAYAERSTLADRAKDGGVAALFPAISDAWLQQSKASSELEKMQDESQALPLLRSGATWFVTDRKVRGFDCPYKNGGIAVCSLQSGNVLATDRRNRQNPIPPAN